MLVAPLRILPVESDPAHMHLVIGGSDAEQAHALAAHLALMRRHPEAEGSEYPLGHAGHARHSGGSCLDEADDQARVLSIRVGDTVGIAAFGGGEPPAVSGRVIVPPPSRGGLASLTAPAAAPDPLFRLPDPPPRAS